MGSNRRLLQLMDQRGLGAPWMTKATSGALAVITVGVALTGPEVAEFRRAEGHETDAEEFFAERLLVEARERADRVVGKPATTLLRWGDPAEAIINTIVEKKFDAIVVGRRGRGRLSGLLLGSVSQKLASLAPCILSSCRNFVRFRRPTGRAG